MLLADIGPNISHYLSDMEREDGWNKAPASLITTVSIRHRPHPTTVRKTDAPIQVSQGEDGGVQITQRKLCLVCSRAVAPYVCPRCRVSYCSSACYKQHGAACTEAFYKAKVEQEVGWESKDDHDRNKMRSQMSAVLDRVKASREHAAAPLSPPPDANCQAETLVSRIAAALYDGGEEGDVDSVLTELTAEDQRLLERVLSSGGGQVAKLIKPWRPWWENKGGLAIEEVHSRSSSSSVGPVEAEGEAEGAGVESWMESCCGLHSLEHLRQETTCESLQSFRSLAGAREPSRLAALCLVDFTAAYAYTLRRYNGCWCHDVMEAASLFVSLSPALYRDARYQSVGQAMRESSCAIQSSMSIGMSFPASLWSDVHAIMLDCCLTACALADGLALVTAAAALTLPPEHEKGGGKDTPKTTKKAQRKRKGQKRAWKQLEAHRRKLEFFMLWVQQGEGSNTTASELVAEAAEQVRESFVLDSCQLKL